MKPIEPRRVRVLVLFVLALVAVSACQSTDNEALPAVTSPTTTEPDAGSADPPDGEATPAPPMVPAIEAGDAAPAKPGVETTAVLTGVRLMPVADGLASITNMAHAGDDRLFVTQQPGLIRIIDEGELIDDAFLDIRDATNLQNASERGLLDVAFHPDYARNGLFFVNYTDRDGDTVISSFEVSDDPNRADPESEVVILRVDQPFKNHNGGHIEFGPEGYLYIAMGDGGSSGDPRGNGQNTESLLGAILRIDVDDGEPYAIPEDNPFVADDSVRDEIWAYGVRNPWGFGFDVVNGDLFFGDVGQDDWEEINQQPAGVGGQNYGWNVMEADTCFESSDCNAAGLVPPVSASNHDTGVCSVTGGAIYRGERFPSMRGAYFFGDLCLGVIWAMSRDGAGGWVTKEVARLPLSSVAFATDVSGDLFVADRLNDAIFRIEPAD